MSQKKEKKIIVDTTGMENVSDKPQESVEIKDENKAAEPIAEEAEKKEPVFAVEKESALAGEKEPVPADKKASVLDENADAVFVEKEEDKEENSAEQSDKKSRKGLFIIGGIAILLLLIAVIGYGSVAIHYQTCFLPGTYINGVACNELEVPQVADLIEENRVGNYSLVISGKTADGVEEVLGTVKASDIDMGLKDGLLRVQEIFDRQNPLLWIEALGKREVTHTMDTEIHYSQDKLCSILENMILNDEKDAELPKDAYISEYSEEKGGYEIIPEVQGSQLDTEKVIQAVMRAIDAGETQLDLVEEACYKTPEVTSQDAQLIELKDTLNMWLDTKITYDWVGNEVVLDRETLKDWISVRDGAAVLDEDAVADFVASNARKYDNYGANRDFVTSQGVTLNLPSGAFGWRTNREKETEALIELIKTGTVSKREPEYSSKAPRKDGNNIGSSYVEIDLTNQHLYLYKDGVLVLESLFVSGKMTDAECVTPQGVFRITYKTVNATLRGGDYAEFVYYWMPFHGNYGMHDATWRTEFGGDIYLTDGSHGCINLPLENAEVIYNYMYAGYPVICYYY